MIENKKIPIVSVVVPTYNRYQYLYDCVRSLHDLQSEEIEFVIQDNTPDNKDFSTFIDTLNDSRIKYYHQMEHVSVSENCDLGVAHATGDFVCMIGDDDTVCSSIVKAAHFMKDNNIEACCFNFPGFNWPDMTFENGMTQESNMFFKTKADGKAYIVDVYQEFETNVCKGDLTTTVPRVYHGLVSRDCLLRIYSRIGTYFPGPSPDIANAVATCLTVGKAVYLNDYLIVSGYGRVSGRGEGNRKQHFGKLEEKPWLPKDIREKWDPNIPLIFSAETIVAQSVSQALNILNVDGNKHKLDYSTLYATYFWHHKDVAADMISFVIRSPRRLIWFIEGLLKRVFLKYNKKQPNLSNYKDLNGVATLMEAQRITEKMSEGLDYSL